MSNLLDFLFNRQPNATPVNASFEVQAQETPAPQPAVTAQPAVRKKKKFKRVGQPTGQPAVPAQGKNLTVVASSIAPKKSVFKNRLSVKNIAAQGKSNPVAASAVAPKSSVFKNRLNVKNITAQGKSNPVAASSVAPKKPVLVNTVAPKKKTPVKSFLAKPGVKKAGKVALIAAAPVAAGAFIAIKNRKAIASGAKKIVKKISFKRK